jgi:hypothetical protein
MIELAEAERSLHRNEQRVPLCLIASEIDLDIDGREFECGGIGGLFLRFACTGGGFGLGLAIDQLLLKN